MEEGSKQGTGNQQPSVNPKLTHKKVLQLSESFIHEVKASQQDTANQSQPMQPSAQSAPPERSQPIQPAESAPTNGQPTPASGGQLPIGMSASQLGLSNPNNTNWKSLLKPVLAVAIVLVVLGGGYLLYKSLMGFSTRTFHGDGFTYTVTYNKLAPGVSINGKTYLQGQDALGHPMLLYVGKIVYSKFDCHPDGGTAVSVIATPIIEGQQHNLCYFQSVNSYELNFTHNGTWYYLAIMPKDKNQALDQDTVKMIASSVSISQ